ncbi:hypothetical protein C3L23_04735 [Nautilia sp. PV-1]|uniref:hypothetical protein n=1 Tax=Nautilia sp. PV-1 TaxID=2579250 RepID=UPI000FD734C6|nr:hypothetical protein [Nautilia sp. PV-1]AZV46604.1 hypothetical protein C3L23_04735 [Nautilia sp. PV-1]
MSHIKINIVTQQSFVYTHYFTCNQLKRLEDLLINGGKKRINNQYFTIQNSALLLFKGKKFSGPNYAMDIEKALKEVQLKLKEHC